MKLWVDDLREPPAGWFWSKTSDHAIARLAGVFSDSNEPVAEISFDHDLGGDDTTRAVVLWLCENNTKWPQIVRVHTANPVGREWLEGMINRYGPGVTR